MTDFNRRNLFAAGALAGAAASAGLVPTAAAAATTGPGAGPGRGGPGLADVWGQDFLYQWSPPADYKRNLTAGPRTIRLSSQSTPRLTGAEGTDYAALFKSMRDGGWSACEAASNAWLERKRPDSEGGGRWDG